jgi:hypothetical protein
VRPWRFSRSSRRISLSGACAAAAVLAALWSAWHPFNHMRRLLGHEAATYERLTADDRRRAPVAAIGLDGQMFDFYDSLLSRGDRVYFQVRPGGFSSDYDLPTIIAALGRFYFLPAVQTSDPADATVVVSYFEDPAELHLKFLTQVRAGLQPLWVSRVAAP